MWKQQGKVSHNTTPTRKREEWMKRMIRRRRLIHKSEWKLTKIGKQKIEREEVKDTLMRIVKDVKKIKDVMMGKKNGRNNSGKDEWMEKLHDMLEVFLLIDLKISTLKLSTCPRYLKISRTAV